eukprot:11401179-Prorocentrum_lima.AAC.1
MFVLGGQVQDAHFAAAFSNCIPGCTGCLSFGVRRLASQSPYQERLIGSSSQSHCFPTPTLTAWN